MSANRSPTLSREGAKLSSSTMTVSALIPTRLRAAPNRSRAYCGSPGALVNGAHGVDTNSSCRVCAADTIGMEMPGSSSAPVVHRIQRSGRVWRMCRERIPQTSSALMAPCQGGCARRFGSKCLIFSVLYDDLGLIERWDCVTVRTLRGAWQGQRFVANVTERSDAPRGDRTRETGTAMLGCCYGLGLVVDGGERHRGRRSECEKVRAVAVAANKPML